MAKYILKRLGYIIIVFFLLSILLFGIFKMVPGDPARLMVEGQKQSVSPEQYEMLYQQARVRLGLDKPIPVQYLSWMGNILQGDFGYSTVYRIPVKELIGPPMKNTIALNVVYYIFLFAIGIPLGIKCAVKKDTVFDTSLQVATMIGISIPSFISALIFIYLSNQWNGHNGCKFYRLPCILRLFISYGTSYYCMSDRYRWSDPLCQRSSS